MFIAKETMVSRSAAKDMDLIRKAVRRATMCACASRSRTCTDDVECSTLIECAALELCCPKRTVT